MANKTDIGSAMFYRIGTNPYSRDPEVLAANEYHTGESRKAALEAWRILGRVPEGYAVWDDRSKENLTSPNQVEWGDDPVVDQFGATAQDRRDLAKHGIAWGD